MINISIIENYNIKSIIQRQFPNNDFIIDDYRFFINNNIKESDYVVCYHNIENYNKINIDKNKSILIYPEFPCIEKNINDEYLNLFDYIWCFGRSKLNIKKQFDNIGIFLWFAGTNMGLKNVCHKTYKTYKDLEYTHPQKEKLLSIITSNRIVTSGHQKRYIFCNKIKKYFGNLVDIYGRGLNTFNDKYDVIAPYKYHICIENSSVYDGISEKLFDPFLCESFPIYYGAPNVYDYFNNNSLETINIEDVDDSIKKIKNIIENNYFDLRKKELLDMKKKVMNEYNFVFVLKNIVKDIYENT